MNFVAKRHWLLVLACLSIAKQAFPSLSSKIGKGDLEKLQGIWVATVAQRDGKVTNPRIELIFRKDCFIVKFEPDPKTGLPQEITLAYERDPSGDPQAIRQKVVSPAIIGATRTFIYRLRGDILELCYHLDYELKDVPPKTFDGKKGSNQDLITFKRLKP